MGLGQRVRPHVSIDDYSTMVVLLIVMAVLLMVTWLGVFIRLVYSLRVEYFMRRQVQEEENGLLVRQDQL